MPNTFLSTVVIIHFMLTMILSGEYYYYPHFTSEETDTERVRLATIHTEGRW